MLIFTGEVRVVAFGFAPPGWAECDGSLLQIAENQALYQLIGTTYGGDGNTTFALPDYRGRVGVGMGQGAGLSSYALGKPGGLEKVRLTPAQLPSHSHSFAAASADAAVMDPAIGTYAQVAVNDKAAALYSETSDAQALSTVITPFNGQGQPHENRQPTQALQYIIALVGSP